MVGISQYIWNYRRHQRPGDRRWTDGRRSRADYQARGTGRDKDLGGLSLGNLQIQGEHPRNGISENPGFLALFEPNFLVHRFFEGLLNGNKYRSRGCLYGKNCPNGPGRDAGLAGIYQ